MSTNSYKFEGLARALSAISHLGDSTGGTISVFRRESMCVDGVVVKAPIISGNSFRGQLRDAGMKFMLEALGQVVPQSNGTDLMTTSEEGRVTLQPGAFDFLTSGGALTKEAGRGIDVGQARRLRELIPLVGVFGGACGRQILPGKLKIGKWYPVCRELKALIPPRYHDLPEIHASMYDLMDLHSFTRTDDKKSDKWQKYLPQAQVTLLEAPKVRKTKEGEEIAEKPGVAQQMRYTQEVMIAGVRFWCWMQLEDVTDLEKAAFASALYEWSKAPFIGGQSRHGCGLVELDLANWMSISPLTNVSGPAVEMQAGEAYQEHLRTKKEDILAVLKDVQ